MSHRIRRHADPLQCRVAVGAQDWMRAYCARGEGDIWLDLGCGKGDLLAQLAEDHPAAFFIGIEVRLSVARRFFGRYRHIPNLLLFHGNVNLSIPSMMGGKKAEKVLIHFPDPFDHKPRYRKRQMVNETLVEGLCAILSPSGMVSVKTDRENLFREMDALFLARMERCDPPSLPCRCSAMSEWELDCLKRSMPIFSGGYRLADR